MHGARAAPHVVVVVLAAGSSTRFLSSAGGHKLLAPLRAMPVIRWSVTSALDAAIGDVVVVTGLDSAPIEAALAGMPVRIVPASDAALGLSASLRRGVEAVRGSADAVIVALGDQPAMDPEAYRRVVETWVTSRAAIVVPSYPNTSAPAHPALFAASVFDELIGLTGDVGARSVIARDPSRVAASVMDWPMPRDVDTLEDLARVDAELG